jgi:hypothetical protein
MSVSSEKTHDLSNGIIAVAETKEFYRDLVTRLMAKKNNVSIQDLRKVEPHYNVYAGYVEWQNVKRGVAGFEATRRAAFALNKLQNI